MRWQSARRQAQQGDVSAVIVALYSRFDPVAGGEPEPDGGWAWVLLAWVLLAWVLLAWVLLESGPCDMPSGQDQLAADREGCPAAFDLGDRYFG